MTTAAKIAPCEARSERFCPRSVPTSAGRSSVAVVSDQRRARLNSEYGELRLRHRTSRIEGDVQRYRERLERARAFHEHRDGRRFDADERAEWDRLLAEHADAEWHVAHLLPAPFTLCDDGALLWILEGVSSHNEAVSAIASHFWNVRVIDNDVYAIWRGYWIRRLQLSADQEDVFRSVRADQVRDRRMRFDRDEADRVQRFRIPDPGRFEDAVERWLTIRGRERRELEDLMEETPGGPGELPRTKGDVNLFP